MNLYKAIDFIWMNARQLDRAIFDYRFFEGPPERVLSILRTYQNTDGGFGHALEPDLRTPASQPVFVEFALGTLRDCGLRDSDMALRACDFLARHADFEQGITPVLPSYNQYPHAGHWDGPYATTPSPDRLIGLVGLARWQGVRHPWLDQAVSICLEKIATTSFTDAHTILPAFHLLESVSGEYDTEPLFQKLSTELLHCRFFCADTPVAGYGLTPLDYAPEPTSYCRRLFSTDQIDNHLADLASRQVEDGGWPVTWGPPGPAANWEWRAHITVKALCVFKAYGKI